MAKKRQVKARTPSRIMWDIIASEMLYQRMTQAELAKRAGVSRVTVCTDGKDPEKVPQFRLWLYFAILGINAEKILAPIADEHAEMIIRRELP